MLTPASVLRLIAPIRPHPTKAPSTSAGDRAERGDEHRLEADHPLDPVVGHADDAQQAELAAPLEDRQRQRVDDADERDDDAHQQQPVDGVDEEVEDRADQPADGVALVDGDVGAQVGLLVDRVLGLGLGARGDVDEGDGRGRVADELIEGRRGRRGCRPGTSRSTAWSSRPRSDRPCRPSLPTTVTVSPTFAEFAAVEPTLMAPSPPASVTAIVPSRRSSREPLATVTSAMSVMAAMSAVDSSDGLPVDRHRLAPERADLVDVLDGLEVADQVVSTVRPSLSTR